MELISAATLVSIALVLLAILVSVLSSNSFNKRRPPGPRCLPFIGSLLHILTSEPQVALRDLAKKHGPVMYLRLGHVDTVVISSPAAAQEVLRDSSLTFASRPNLMAVEIMSYGNIDIGFAPYGAYWRMMRKICTLELLSPRKVKQFAPIRDSETLSLIRNICDAGEGGQPVNIGRLLVSCANKITAKATFGAECGPKLQEQFLSAIAVALEFSGGVCVGDLFPYLRFVDVLTGLRRRLWRARRELDVVFGKIIDVCETRRQEKNTGTGTATTTGDDDLLTIMLRIRDEGALEVPITMENIKAIIADMFTGGTETTSSSVEWIMSELMRNPEVMAKAQEEVRQVFDNKRPQDHEGHLEDLRYTMMVVKEGMRLHPVLPLLLPRICAETCNVGGFEVTKGSRVMVNAWAIARSPEHWQDAEKFIPERFLNSMVDYKGTQFEYLPFGSGRRMCPGVNFGLAAVELIVARLLYYFDWKLPSCVGPDDLDMDMVVSATCRRKNQLHLVALPHKVQMDI